MNIYIVNCFDTWEHRVDLLYKVMSEAGHQVKVLTSDYRHIEKNRRIEFKRNYRFFTATPYEKNMSASRLYSHIQLSRDIFSYVEKNERKIDLLWVLAPPNIFVKDAGYVKRRHSHIKLVIDLIDLWPETMPIQRLKRVFPFTYWKKLRNGNLRYADVIVTECNLYQKVLGKAVKTLKLRTLYLARENKGYEPRLETPKNKIALCYLGSINNIIDIEAIAMIIRKCRQHKPVILHIIGEGEKKRELVRKCKDAGAEVIYHGRVYDREEKQRIFDSCHYGLNIMKPSVCVGLTMKSIDYLEFGLPIINNIRGDTWNIVDKFGIGVNYNEKTAWYSIIGNDNQRKRISARDFFVKYLIEDIFAKEIQSIFIEMGL